MEIINKLKNDISMEKIAKDLGYAGKTSISKRLNNLIKKNDSISEGKIQTWAFMDIVKRKIAKINKLNWIEFFNIEEFNEWYEDNA